MVGRNSKTFCWEYEKKTKKKHLHQLQIKYYIPFTSMICLLIT